MLLPLYTILDRIFINVQLVFKKKLTNKTIIDAILSLVY